MSFVVDMPAISLITEKDISANSRNNLQKQRLSRKGPAACHPGSDAKTNLTTPPAAKPEKHAKQQMSPHAEHHHRIIIENAAISRSSATRLHSPRSFTPRTILVYLATLSSMGTIVLIYLTLSMSKDAN